MAEVTRTFTRQKQTKNKVVFEEQVPDDAMPVFGGIYLWKWFAKDANQITITVKT